MSSARGVRVLVGDLRVQRHSPPRRSSIQLKYRATLVYTPGKLGRAHPRPQDTIPAPEQCKLNNIVGVRVAFTSSSKVILYI